MKCVFLASDVADIDKYNQSTPYHQFSEELMFFNRRKRYNGEVGSLLSVLEIDIEEAGAFKLMELVDTAWAEKYSAHEAALMAAYSFAAGLHQAGLVERADALVKDNLLPVQEDWVKKGTVRPQFVSICSKTFEQRLAALRLGNRSS